MEVMDKKGGYVPRDFLLDHDDCSSSLYFMGFRSLGALGFQSIHLYDLPLLILGKRSKWSEPNFKPVSQ